MPVLTSYRVQCEAMKGLRCKLLRTNLVTALWHVGALAEDPKLLLLDELTTFLDVEDQFGVLEAVKAVTHQRKDVTAVLVTHRFEELAYADAASYMEDGRVVFTGSPEQMKARLRAMGASVR
eukprot:GHUV01031563.1.p1 GENE.GHUV01031563.1~~GHUV01031563.1.p1  ORF type:complete len:122 (+),score=18.55 GHUV01031563.1:266-631(+)